MAPGPASMGIPIGTMPASSLVAASSVSGTTSCVADLFASSMSSPISSRITPPAISKAGNVMPKIRKMYCPAAANADKMTNAVKDALRAVRTRFFSS